MEKNRVVLGKEKSLTANECLLTVLIWSETKKRQGGGGKAHYVAMAKARITTQANKKNLCIFWVMNRSCCTAASVQSIHYGKMCAVCAGQAACTK